MRFQSSMKLADVIHHDPDLLPVVRRFGIKLGFGDRSIVEVCDQYSIDYQTFILIINTFHDRDFFPQQELINTPLPVLVKYLHKAHEDYVNENLPEIEDMIRELAREEGQNEHIQLIKDFFNGYKHELIQHIQKEEERVYPYVIELEKAYRSGKVSQQLIHQMNAYSIHDYEAEHDDVEEKLFDLKNILIKYLPPTRNSSLVHKILMELFRLEKDLNEHSRMEDVILVNKADTIEKKLLSHTS